MTAAGVGSCAHRRECSPRVQMLGRVLVPVSSQIFTIQLGMGMGIILTGGGRAAGAPGRARRRQRIANPMSPQSATAPAPAGQQAGTRSGRRHPSQHSEQGGGHGGNPQPRTWGTPAHHATQKRAVPGPTAPTTSATAPHTPPRPSKGLAEPRRALYGSIRSTERQCGVWDGMRTDGCGVCIEGKTHPPCTERRPPSPARQRYVSGTPPERSRHRTTKPKACGLHAAAGWGDAVTGQRGRDWLACFFLSRLLWFCCPTE